MQRRAERWAAAVWPSVQLTAAATAAWVIARTLTGRPDPFFAPIAAIVALSSPIGERGTHAIRLLSGVFIGIGSGELTLWLFGGGYGRLALATFGATVVARALGGPRLVIVQAAAGAVLTVASANGQVGMDRVVDALIGAGVALVGSQFLFSPEPVALVRRAEMTALVAMAKAFDLTADALESGDEGLSERSLAGLRTLRDDLTELARLRTASHQVARHSVLWRWQRSPVVEETENAGHLDLLGVSCITAVRTTMATDQHERPRIVPHVRQLADVLRTIATDPGDRGRRQTVVDQAFALAADVARSASGGGAEITTAAMALRLAIADLIVFAGVEPSDVRRALDDGVTDVEVRNAPPVRKLPFQLNRPWGTPRRQ
jgi:uncharacterized membrane protein YgaE (UPF0421/DUF939 family)